MRALSSKLREECVSKRERNEHCQMLVKIARELSDMEVTGDLECSSENHTEARELQRVKICSSLEN